MTRKLSLLLSGITVLAVAVITIAAAPEDDAKLHEQGLQLFRSGNFKEALGKFRPLALDPDTARLQVEHDLRLAVHSLNNLARTSEADQLIEDSVNAHSDNWRLLKRAAQLYRTTTHWGFLVTGEYERGNRRGGGKQVNSMLRDRTRGLQLFERARKLAADDEASPADVATLYSDYALTLRSGTGYTENWRLQALTDLDQLPDYVAGHWHGYGRNQGAPVDAEGNPVYHRIPLTFEAAESDGERWRWLLTEAANLAPGRKLEFRMRFAQLLYESFSCQTMQQFSWWGARRTRQDDQKAGAGAGTGAGTYELHTSSDDETIARLATGVRRFKLPDEHNFIRIYEEVAAAGKSSQGEQARGQLAQIFENRRQYPTAADAWRAGIREYGPGNRNWRQKRLNQIVAKWGRFENSTSQPSGRGAVVEYRYRNGKSVHFEAWPIKVEKLIQDAKAYLKSNPARIHGENMEVQNIGYRLVTHNQTKYLDEKAADWNVKLDPPDDHVDDRITVTTPLQQAGAYLVTAKMSDGNISRIILWVSDTDSALMMSS
jgi:hypothetical protein